jgi:hypothetical protein
MKADPKLYDHIDQLLMSKFIDCYCDKKYESLIIEGEASVEQLEEAWSNIFYQFIDANSDNESIYILTLKKDISLLEYEIKLVECIASMLMINYSEKLIKMLEKLRVRVNGVDPDKSDYVVRLKKIVATLAPRKMQLQDMLSELKVYEQSIETKAVDRQVFKTMFTRLSKFQGYPVRTHEVVVSEYIAILKDFLLSVSSKQNQLEYGQER